MLRFRIHDVRGAFKCSSYRLRRGPVGILYSHRQKGSAIVPSVNIKIFHTAELGRPGQSDGVSRSGPKPWLSTISLRRVHGTLVILSMLKAAAGFHGFHYIVSAN
jgi:hypothetical protein